MANIEDFINRFCSSEMGYKNKTTTDYIKTIATKAKTFQELEGKLQDFDIDTSKPNNKQFALDLFDKLAVRTEDKANVQQMKKENKEKYQLVDMSRPSKQTYADEEVYGVKNLGKSEAALKDQRERDEFAKRLMEKDKSLGSKKFNIMKNPQGITLSANEKMEVLPDLREKSRQAFLDKREKEKIYLYKKKLEDDKNIFPDYMLTEKEIKKREIDERVIAIAEGNYVPNASLP